MNKLFIFILLLFSCSDHAFEEAQILNQSYLNHFFCRNMDVLNLNTYRDGGDDASTLKIRSLIEAIITHSKNPKALERYGVLASSMMDSLVHSKAYLIDDYEILGDVELAKKDMQSAILGQKYQGIIKAIEIIVTFSYIDLGCGYGKNHLGLFITDTIILDSGQLYEFDYDVRPAHSSLIYYNTYARNDERHKTNITIDTRNVKEAIFEQEISASITNPITLETKTYSAPMVVKIKR